MCCFLEVDDEDSGTEKKEGDEEPKKPKVEINIGSEHVKKIEVILILLYIL